MNCYVEFEILDEISFNDLARTYKELAEAKNSGRPREDDFWLTTFPDYAIKKFYFIDGDKTPGFSTDEKTENNWHFYALTSLLQTDYDLEYKELKRSGSTGRLEYYPFGYPYGGVTGLLTFIDAFGCKPTNVDDGTGVYHIDWTGPNKFELTENKGREQDLHCSGAEILTSTPISGGYPELHFGNNFNSKLWIKFASKESEEWMGCFSKAYEGGLCVALTSEDHTRGFIVAGGRGYLIDIQQRALIRELEDHPLIESAITTTKPNYFLAGTSYSIYVFDDFGLLHEAKPDMMTDGIYFKGQLQNKAIGNLATMENQYSKNIDFEFDLTTFQLRLIDSKVVDNVWYRVLKRLFGIKAILA